MIDLNVVNFITIGLICIIFSAIVRYLLGLIAAKKSAA